MGDLQRGCVSFSFCLKSRHVRIKLWYLLKLERPVFQILKLLVQLNKITSGVQQQQRKNLNGMTPPVARSATARCGAGRLFDVSSGADMNLLLSEKQSAFYQSSHTNQSMSRKVCVCVCVVGGTSTSDSSISIIQTQRVSGVVAAERSDTRQMVSAGCSCGRKTLSDTQQFKWH